MSLWNLFCCSQSQSPQISHEFKNQKTFSSTQTDRSTISKQLLSPQKNVSLTHSSKLKNYFPTFTPNSKSHNTLIDEEFHYSQTLLQKTLFSEINSYQPNSPYGQNNYQIEIYNSGRVCSNHRQLQFQNISQQILRLQQLINLSNLEFIRSKEIKEWSVKQVVLFLNLIQLSSYSIEFYRNKVRGRDLITLNHQEMMIDLKMTNIDVQILIKLINYLKNLQINKNIVRKKKKNKIIFQVTNCLKEINNKKSQQKNEAIEQVTEKDQQSFDEDYDKERDEIKPY